MKVLKNSLTDFRKLIEEINLYPYQVQILLDNAIREMSMSKPKPLFISPFTGTYFPNAIIDLIYPVAELKLPEKPVFFLKNFSDLRDGLQEHLNEVAKDVLK